MYLGNVSYLSVRRETPSIQTFKHVSRCWAAGCTCTHKQSCLQSVCDFLISLLGLKRHTVKETNDSHADGNVLMQMQFHDFSHPQTVLCQEALCMCRCTHSPHARGPSCVLARRRITWQTSNVLLAMPLLSSTLTCPHLLDFFLFTRQKRGESHIWSCVFLWGRLMETLWCIGTLHHVHADWQIESEKPASVATVYNDSPGLDSQAGQWGDYSFLCTYRDGISLIQRTPGWMFPHIFAN